MNNNDVNKMFLEKNKEILKNKLVLDINNNIDSLSKIIVNILELEIDKTIHNINLILERDSGILAKYLIKNKKKLIDIILNEVRNKEQEVIKIVNELDFNDDFNKTYNNKVKETTKSVKKLYHAEIKKLSTKTEVNKLITLINKEMTVDTTKRNRLLYYLNHKLPYVIIDKIDTQLNERDVILNNNAKEAYNKFLNLNSNFS